MFEKKMQPDPDPLDHYNETAAARVGHRIRKIRIARGMTQAALGDAVGLSADRIQQYENGFRRPRAELLKKIAGALGVNTLSLVDPAVTDPVGAMYAFFELEDLFNMRIGEGPGDRAPSLCLSVDDRNKLYPYLKDWLAVKSLVSAQLEAASSDQEQDKIWQAYHAWKWSYPKVSFYPEDVSRAKEYLLKRIRALQEKYDSLL
jgi:transcriptional regulator with XRE-family HTH domain